MKYTAIIHGIKNDKFQIKIVIFSYFAENIDRENPLSMF